MQDTYARVTQQVINALEAGAPPWIRPWDSRRNALPVNHSTHRDYRGINILLLSAAANEHGFADNRWLTFRQTAELGGHVRGGEHGTQIVFFRWLEADDATEHDEAPCKRVIPLLRTYTVFNLEQVEGVSQSPRPEPTWSPESRAATLLIESGAKVEYGGNRACYMPERDIIRMPPPGWFRNADGYYATMLHELTHWTGHASRCNRTLGRRHGLEAYAFEELVAEMGAAFLCAYCGMEGRLEHASYIESWLAALRGDKRLIFTAAAQAQKAADFLTGQLAPASDAAEQVAA